MWTHAQSRTSQKAKSIEKPIVSTDSSLVMALSAYNGAPTPNAVSKVRHSNKKKRAKLVLFMHAVIQYMQTFAPEFKTQVKCIIRECTQRNRRGDPLFSPLPRSLMLNVRNCIGEQHWAAALVFHRCYIQEKGTQFKGRHVKLLSQPKLSLSAALFLSNLPEGQSVSRRGSTNLSPPTAPLGGMSSTTLSQQGESFNLRNFSRTEQVHFNDARIRSNLVSQSIMFGL